MLLACLDAYGDTILADLLRSPFRATKENRMYTPASFTESDQPTLHEFIEQNSFAMLVSAVEHAPSVSHLPLLLDRGHGPHGRLIGHMAQANPDSEQIEGRPILAVFTGPHAYISPAWLEDRNVVPTWNYLAVHVHGVARLEPSRDQRLTILRRYVEFYEASQLQPWSLDAAAPDFIDDLLDGIVGFTIEIDRIEGKWKLSQNHSPKRRQEIINGLRRQEPQARHDIADLMNATLPPAT